MVNGNTVINYMYPKKVTHHVNHSGMPMAT